MKLPDPIARLAALPPDDRSAVLDALSPQARERLLQLMRTEHVVDVGASRCEAVAEPNPAEPLEARIVELSRLPADTLAEVLAGEPIWVTAALLRSADWPWRKQLLHRLPHVALRLCPTLDGSGPLLTERFKQALLERIAARVAVLAVPVPGRFERLVQKMTARRIAAWRSIQEGRRT